MGLDLDNLGSAPDIENFDASKMDRGDALLNDEPEVKDEPVVEPEVKEEVEDEPEAKDEPEEEPEEEAPKPKAKAKDKEAPDLDTLRDEIKTMATHIAEGDSDECADEFDDLLEDFKVRTVTKLADDDVEDFHAEAKKIVSKYYELED